MGEVCECAEGQEVVVTVRHVLLATNDNVTDEAKAASVNVSGVASQTTASARVGGTPGGDDMGVASEGGSKEVAVDVLRPLSVVVTRYEGEGRLGDELVSRRIGGVC